MPRKKDLKRLARDRMQKTGESYTTARAQLLRKKQSSGKETPDYAALAGMSDDAVRAKTGRTWAAWTDVLDAVEAHTWPHRDIAAHLHEKLDVPGWWAQMVTVGYERIRGLRQAGQRRDGTREISKSKTVNVPLDTLYRACSDARRRGRWLPGTKLTARKATPGKSIRFRWSDDTPVEFYFVEKGAEKCQITIQHRGLASKEDADRMKTFWGEQLAVLANQLAS